jgi:hypothetical protein
VSIQHEQASDTGGRANEPFDVYRSSLAKSQLDYDREDYRRSLYTNTKPDHPRNPRTEEPCDCERGGRDWEKGEAMRVEWPPERERSAQPPVREPATAAEAWTALQCEGTAADAVRSYLAPGPQPRYDTPQARAEAQADREAGS